MASMTIRDLDARLEARLCEAARNNRPMEEEARARLKAALTQGAGSLRSLYKSIRARLESLRGIELTAEPRASLRTCEIEK